MVKSIIENNNKIQKDKQKERISNKRKSRLISSTKRCLLFEKTKTKTKTKIISPEYAYFDLEKSNLYQRRKKKKFEEKNN